jgi:hypothetical protein
MQKTNKEADFKPHTGGQAMQCLTSTVTDKLVYRIEYCFNLQPCVFDVLVDELDGIIVQGIYRCAQKWCISLSPASATGCGLHDNTASCNGQIGSFGRLGQHRTKRKHSSRHTRDLCHCLNVVGGLMQGGRSSDVTCSIRAGWCRCYAKRCYHPVTALFSRSRTDSST